MLNYATH